MKITLLYFVFVANCVFAQTFKHPGILCSQIELDFIKTKVKAGEQPYKARFDAVKSSVNLNHSMYDWSKGTLTDADQSAQFDVIDDASMIEKSAYVAYISDAKTDKDTYYALAMRLMRNMYKFTSAGDALEINWTTYLSRAANTINR